MRATKDDRKTCPGGTKNTDTRYRDTKTRPCTPRQHNFPLQRQNRLSRYNTNARFPATETRNLVPVRHDDAFPCYRDKNNRPGTPRRHVLQLQRQKHGRRTVPIQHKSTFPRHRDTKAIPLHAATTQFPATGTTTEDKGTVAPRDSAYSNVPGGDYPGDNTKQHRLAVTRPDRLQALQQFRHPLTQSSGGPMASPRHPPKHPTPSKTKRRNPQNEETRRREPPGEREERRRVQLWGPETSPPE